MRLRFWCVGTLLWLISGMPTVVAFGSFGMRMGPVQRPASIMVHDGVMTDPKRALVIVATNDDTFCELSSIESALEYENIEVDTIDMRTTGVGLEQRIDGLSGPWSYVYVCSHGNGQTFGDDALNLDVPWEDLSQWICLKLDDGATFLIACCRGGFNEVAYQIFSGCGMVDVVIGPRFNAYSGDLRAGFIAYLHHVESRHNDPTAAAIAATAAAGIDFKMYDRLETTASDDYRAWFWSRPSSVQSASEKLAG